jgi:opacity protein-like surface antigen
MKTQLLTAVLAVGFAGFATAAQAQMSPTTPSQTDNATQTNTQTYQQQTTTSSYQSSSSSALSGAVTQVSTAGEVVVGPDAASSTVPQFTIGMGTSSINVLNTTPKPVVFSVPTLNISYQVAPNSERLIQVDQSQTASLTPGQQVAYYINDVNGNQIASSTLTNNQEIASMINTNTTVATEETSTTTATTEQKQPASRRATVRGFW